MTAAPAALPGPVGRWAAGARPRTLAAAGVPVVVGTAVGWWLRSGATAGGAPIHGSIIWWRAGCALVVALALQVGTNYANDYADGRRGTDAVRVGPTRLVASGLASPGAVRRAALAAFGVAALAGLVLALETSLVLLALGAASIAAGWFYTGGPRPYGYAGYGEVFVFVFFGLVAVVGTVYATAGRVPGLAFLAAVPVGLLTVALLVVNNLRDIPTDGPAGKRTLAVLLGAARTRAFYAGLVLAALALVGAVAAVRPWALVALVALVVAIRPLRIVLGRAEGRELIRALGMTGALQLCFSLLLAVGIAW